MTDRKEIMTLDDIEVLVDNFYDRVRQDDLLKDIFNAVIEDRWPAHLEKMYRFWQTVLLGDHTYHGTPFPHHARLPVEWVHFQRWLDLFHETVDYHFTGEAAARAKWQAGRMAEMFHSKIQYYKNSPTASPIQ